MALLSPGQLNRRVRIERKVKNTSFSGAGSGSWALVAEVWASVLDVLPSRAEQLGEGISIETRPARVRMRFRTDIDSSMRFVMGNRVMQIIAGPAEVGFREGIEFMVEDFSVAGNGA
ncbi:head-tail adaptor protein [uncultured Sphingomonas sp.]|uniref:head-tail adaptor protein n=1 Tax=uncultured Sphingomonas sp. TaxID=158754 RepID=UPI0025937EA5|nr:head-tail adaptor protein [uncultured Sphingomonas sp.]